MKKTPFFAVLLFVTLLLSFSLTSCGGNKDCDVCVDEDGDGVCDVCKKEIQIDDVVLFEDGEPTFQIVLSDDLSDSMKQTVNTQIKMMLQKEHDVEIDVVTEGDSKDVEIPTEILIGEVTSRGERYRFDGHTLGMEGYAYKIVGTKILVNGGSDDMLAYAIREFAIDILAADDITALTMTKDDVVVEIQDDYSVTSLKMSGEDMWGYTIAADLTRKYYEETALKLQSELYKRTGYWFNIVDVENATEKSIVMKHVDGVTGESSYKASVKGKQLVIECAYDNKLYNVTQEFAASTIYMKEGEVDLKDTSYTKDISVVYYDEFEAKGDGETDDFVAIYNTHVFANECGQTVKAKPDATYYIFNTRQLVAGKLKATSVPIRTNTDWQGAKFIIDDLTIGAYSGAKNYDLSSSQIFEILPDEEHEGVKFEDKAKLDELVAKGFDTDTDHIDFKVDGWDGSLMLIPYNNEHYVFRRKGPYAAHSGGAMHEVIVIDKDGNVDPETPIMFQYTNIDYMMVYKLDPNSAIRVGNATIETIDSREEHIVDGEYVSSYKKRGIEVFRSYTVVHDVEHIVSGGFNLKERADGHAGAASNGMFRATNASYVTFKDCIIPGRQAYNVIGASHSSYNFGALCVNKIVLDHCIQSNFWVSVDEETGIMTGTEDYEEGAYTSVSSATVKNEAGENVSVRMHWGIGGTNYCKNMEYIDSKISRFDAHAGLCNGKIIRSSTNCISITGVGDMIIEDAKWYQYADDIPLLFLRSDYGFYWDGDITLKNTEAYIYDITDVSPTLYLINHKYTNWYFGYTTAFPNLTVDNLDVYSIEKQAPVDAGYEIYLSPFLNAAQKMHLPGDSGRNAIFDYRDIYWDNYETKITGYDRKGNPIYQGDGYIDEPLFDYNFDGTIDECDFKDLDGNGHIGNTSMKIDDSTTWGASSAAEDYDVRRGITHPDCTININVVKPPEYIKILKNDGAEGKGGYVFKVPNTFGISDGGWNRASNTADTMGGFFGNTKFIYGEGEEDFLRGTNHLTDTHMFLFYRLK